MPDTVAVSDLCESGGFGESVVFAGHAGAGRDDLADFTHGAKGGFGKRRDGAIRLADHADFNAADRVADAGAVAAKGQLPGVAEELGGRECREW